jgi:hypothetical protein
MTTVTINGVTYDPLTGARIESKPLDKENKSLIDKGIAVTDEVDTTESFPENVEGKKLTLTTKATPVASPVSVIGQFTNNFIEALFYLPDEVVKQTAQELSDSLNLGWSDDEIFQFADLVNKGKVGNTYIGVEHPELAWMFPQPVDKGIKEILETQGRDAAINAMEELGVPRNEFEQMAAIAGDMMAITYLLYGGIGAMGAGKAFSATGSPHAASHAQKMQQFLKTAENLPPGMKTANLWGTMALDDMMQFMRTNPGKAALFDLTGSAGWGYGMVKKDQWLTPEFKANHPILYELANAGIPLATSAGGPIALLAPGVILRNTPTGRVVNFTGGVLKKFLSMKDGYQRNKFIREVQSKMDAKVAKQMKPFFEEIMKNPELITGQNMAMVIRRDIVGGEAVNALRNQISEALIKQNPDLVSNPAALESAIIEKLFALGALEGAADDATMAQFQSLGINLKNAENITLLKPIQKDGKITGYEDVSVPVGPFSSAALDAYAVQLQNMFKGKDWQKIPEFSTSLVKPTADEINDWILNKLYQAKVQLSMAEQSQNSQLISLQQKLENTATMSEMSLLNDRKQNNVQTVNSFWTAMFPHIDDAPTYIFNTLNKEVVEINKALLDAEMAAIAASKQLVGDQPIISGAEQVAINQGLREQLIQQRKNVIANFRAGDKEIRALKIPVPQNKWEGFQQNIKDLIFEGSDEKMLSYFKDPAAIPEIIKKVMQPMDPNKPFTFSDMMDLYVRIGDDLFDATLAKTTNITSRGKKNLYLAKKAFENFLQQDINNVKFGLIWRRGDTYEGVQALLAGVPEGTPIPNNLIGKQKNVELLNYFQQWKKQVGDIFDKNAAYKVQRFADYGNYFTPDEFFIHEFFKTAADVKQYIKVFGNDQKAMQQLQNTLLDEIRKTAYNKKEGILDYQKVAKWMEKNAAKLSEMPQGFMNLLNNQQALMESSVNRVNALISRKKVVDQTLLGKQLEKIARQLVDTQPDQYANLMNFNTQQLLNEALNSPNLMSQLYNKVRFNTDSEIAFKSMLWKTIGDQVNLENIPKLQAFLNNDKIANSLKTVFNKNELKMLKKLQDSYQIIMTTNFPKGAVIDQLPIIKNIAENLGTTPQSLSSVVRATKEGRISPFNTMIYLGSRLLNARQMLDFRKVYIEALSNPQILDDVIKKEMSVSLFDPLPKKDINFIDRLLWGIGIKPLGDYLAQDPEIIMPNESTIELDQNILKWLKSKEQEKSDLQNFDSQSMNRPPINNASRLSQGVEVSDIMEQISTTPTGGSEITEQAFTSYFPYDTTGQMIAANRGTGIMQAAEGGSVDTSRIRQRVL